ncbi:MAG TPA: hypothetical protein VK869_07565 [Rubrobacteraceae bacterium]|nr:hypothetical protein [Rubrobacteraceae bacterium]
MRRRDLILACRNGESWAWSSVLDQGLSLLAEQCRELLLALYFDPGRPSYAGASEGLGMPVGSIGPTRVRCPKSLRRALTGHWVDLARRAYLSVSPLAYTTAGRSRPTSWNRT